MKIKKPINSFSTVMLIDDNELDNFINQKVIEGSNFSEKVYVSTSGKSALEFLQNITSHFSLVNVLLPDIIFVDINMPLMDGFQFIDQFEKHLKSLNKTIKIVILTSSVSAEDKEKATKCNIPVTFINKPLTEASLQLLK